MAESLFAKVPLRPLAKLPVVDSTEVDGFFEASTQLEEAAQKNFNTRVENEATRQGIVDGQQGKLNTELLYAPTFRGQAYTRAAQKSFLDTVELNATQKIQEIILANPNDSEAAKIQIKGYLNGVVGGFPPRVKERLGQTFLLKSQIRANVGISSIINRERRQFANQREVQALARDNQRSIDIVANAEHIFDRDAKISLKSIAAVIEQRSQIKSDYGAKITDPEGTQIGAFNPAFRERALQQFDIDTSNAAIKSSFNRSNNKEEFLRQFEANEIDLIVKDQFGNDVLDLRPNVRRKAALVNYMQGEISRENVARNAEVRIFRGEVKSDINTIKKGGNLTEKRISLMKTRAHQLGDEQSFAMLSDWVSHSNDMHLMSVMTPSNLDAFVSAERADLENKRDAGETITQTDVEQLEAKEALLDNMSAELEKDPLEWANTVGLIELSPIIPTAKETVTVNGQEISPQVLMNKRVAQAEAVAAHYGRPAKYLTDEEKTTFQKFMTDRNTGPDAKLSLLASLSGFGADKNNSRLDEVLAEISPKAPEYMHIGGMMSRGSQPSVLSDAMEGLAVIQGGGTIQGTRVIQTGTPDVASITDETLGTAYRESPQTRKQVVNVAEAIYTARMFRQGKTDSTDFDEDEWQRALQEASGANFIDGTQFGGVTEYNGQQVHVPSWVEADEFEDFINELTDKDWQDGGFGGAPIIPKLNGEAVPVPMTKEISIFSDLNLVSIGDGQYMVARNKGDEDPRWYRAQVDPTSPVAAVRNGFYVLDLNKIPSGQRTRAMRGARSVFVTPEEVQEQRDKEAKTKKEKGSDLVSGPRSFPEDVESVKNLVREQFEKTKELVRQFTGEEMKQFVKDTISNAEVVLQAMTDFIKDPNLFSGLNVPPDDLQALILDTEEKAKELQRNRSAFNKLSKKKRTTKREEELNNRAIALSAQTERIKQLLQERVK